MDLDTKLRIGIQTIHRRTEPATDAWRPRIDELVALVELVDRCGYDSLWVGDHVSFAVPILDPLLQLAQAAVVSRRLTLGTSVYLLPLRHPAPVAKQVATLDHLTEGRLIFGVGVGGEFPKEYEVCGVPHNERGARLAEANSTPPACATSSSICSDRTSNVLPRSSNLPRRRCRCCGTLPRRKAVLGWVRPDWRRLP